MLNTKSVIMGFSYSMCNYYREKGYDAGNKLGDKYEVLVEDLSPNSNAIVNVSCDFCGKKYDSKYNDYFSSKDSGTCCKGCRSVKTKKTMMERYGVENTSELESVKQKRKDTCMERYGAVSNLCLEETKEQIRNTNMERYGVEYVSQLELHKDKTKETNILKYGFDNPMKNDDVKEKMRISLYENGTCPTSKAQRHLFEIFGGILNYNIKYYNVDLYFEDKNIYLEYDGSGHKLDVSRGKVTEEERKNKDFGRYHFLKKEGLKLIRFLNISDKLPNDKILLEIFNDCVLELKKEDVFHIVVDLDNLK